MTYKLASGIYYGKKLRNQDVEGFNISEWQYDQGATAPRHSHEFAYLNFVLQGGHVETLAKEEIASGPAVLTFHPSEEVHGGEITCSETRILSIEIAPRRREQLLELGLLPKERLPFTSAHSVGLATGLYQEFVRMDGLSPLAIEGIALELLTELGRYRAAHPTMTPPQWLRQVQDLLHARFRDNLSLTEIARTVGVHPDHLVHAFRRQYHCTVGEYLRRLRIEFACRQMISSEMPLAQIALEAGFADQSHFTKTFKLLIGMTPSEFQRQRRPSRLRTIR